MRITTQNINRAAFYTTCGAKYISVEGRPPHSNFTLEVSKWILYYEKFIGIVPYRKYVNQRKRLKRISRKAAGLPVHYSSRKKVHSLNKILGYNLKKFVYGESKQKN